MRLEVVQLPQPIHGVLTHALRARHLATTPMRHALRLGLQRCSDDGVALFLVILVFAAAPLLNLPHRIDSLLPHSPSPQSSGVTIDTISRSDIQILLTVRRG